MDFRRVCLPLLLGIVVASSRGDEKDDFKVPRGQLTFDAEGAEGGRWHSRTPHVPGPASGLTVGRGYDMRFRTREQIQRQMTSAGIPVSVAERYSGGAGLYGESARAYLKMTDLAEITPRQQRELFLIIYDEIASAAKSLAESPAVVKKFGAFDWSKLHPAIRDLVVDLRYRGDYTAATRELIQPAIVRNDLRELARILADREKWGTVPFDRFRRRTEFAERAVKTTLPTPP